MADCINQGTVLCNLCERDVRKLSERVKLSKNERVLKKERKGRRNCENQSLVNTENHAIDDAAKTRIRLVIRRLCAPTSYKYGGYMRRNF